MPCSTSAITSIASKSLASCAWPTFARSGTQLAAEIARIGPVRLLFLLQGFGGWEQGTEWNDLSFYVKHGDRIERIAIVGDERWQSEAMMFAAAGLRKAPVEFFPASDLERARAWLLA